MTQLAAAAAFHSPRPHDSLLRVAGLRTEFDTPYGVIRAVDGVDFTLARGSALGIVGESGSGKSVLARSILGLLPSNASARCRGEIVFDSVDLTRLSERDMRAVRGRGIAMIFQDPMSTLNPVKRIGRQITEVLERRMGLSAAASRTRAVELLHAVGIGDPAGQLDRYPMHLSGGMRQRVVIAIALAGDPKLLIADEPTTALDVTIQAQILDLLNRLRAERNMSIILITHNLGIVSAFTDDVLVMYAGQVVERARTRDLLERPRMRYTEALLNSAPHLRNPPHTRLLAVPGLPPNPAERPDGCRFHPRCGFASRRCEVEAPSLQGPAHEHAFACWHPVAAEAVAC